MPLSEQEVLGPVLEREFNPAVADCGYRAPLTPHLARPQPSYHASQPVPDSRYALSGANCTSTSRTSNGCASANVPHTIEAPAANTNA
jgi:hypothetical protein